MSLSTFTRYASTDAGASALTINGNTGGNLLAVLDACLVNGYTGKTAAGWTKPFANASNIGCYKQGAGAGFNLVINDAGLLPGVGTGDFYDALATGWQTLAGIASPVGSGTGQFPTPAQSLTDGCYIIRKSSAANSTVRPWVVFADASTFYLFIQTGDLAGGYTDFMFGDFYSLNSSTDAYRCIICGIIQDTAAPGNNLTYGSLDFTSTFQTVCPGMAVANNVGGTSGSLVNYYRFGDTAKSTNSGSVAALAGKLPVPNTYDSSYYLSPVFIADSAFNIRGQLRGIYHLCHPASGFTDAQTFSGANDFAGKSFYVVVTGINGGMICIETSATVNTN